MDTSVWKMYCNSISDKMIRRHPHVFGDVIANSTEDVLRNWQQIKAEEKKETCRVIIRRRNAFGFFLLTSFNYQKKVAKVGFDWPDVIRCLGKVRRKS